MQVCITDAHFSPTDALDAFMRGAPGAGACVSFVGLVRDLSSGGAVTGLELQHYPAFTEAEIERMAHDVMKRHAVDDVLIVHRVGRMAPHEPIVLAAAVSQHRAAAFKAVEDLMDRLKTDAPFWKREWRGEDARWVEPTAEDRARRARHEEKQT